MTPVRLEPAALRSRVKHSTTEPLRSHISPFCEKFLCVLSHGVMALKWHDQLTAISASGDGDEVGVSFNRSSLSVFKTATEDKCTTKTTLVKCWKTVSFFEKLILVLIITYIKLSFCQVLVLILAFLMSAEVILFLCWAAFHVVYSR